MGERTIKSPKRKGTISPMTARSSALKVIFERTAIPMIENFSAKKAACKKITAYRKSAVHITPRLSAKKVTCKRTTKKK